ncbi:transcription/translation regulatory transformer protein RfaH [Vibrio sp. TH_r3]|uniref:transcription/translation regulatory transformer protein RfaH n=1 Tax=Vibrio sp. TH_r3 TaxID=3082084 RepID=UPI002954EC1B|nr:transcription/translation regulatory transformer protein RfaH [Vibrio sp. TH_r3]MDV7104069.1 transcription/translation regulatory transformer protein RfaH [Vibrio sp. TH_r3]
MKRWYLLYCKRGDLERAKAHLENQGVECYYPVVEIEKVVRGKRKKVVEPLFASYMFVQFDYEQGPSFTTIRSSRGVVDFIRQGTSPLEVNAQLVAEIKVCEQNTVVQRSDQLPEKGQEVRITQGQFEGIEAIYKEADGDKRSVLLITLMSQTVPVSVDNSNIEVK